MSGRRVAWTDGGGDSTPDTEAYIGVKRTPTTILPHSTVSEARAAAVTPAPSR
jgi:hypothetical protein